MERLTERDEDGYTYYPLCEDCLCHGIGCFEKGCGFLDTIRDKLAAYEDTAMEPEQIKEMQKELEDLRAKTAGGKKK